jgi:hypothetical protein
MEAGMVSFRWFVKMRESFMDCFLFGSNTVVTMKIVLLSDSSLIGDDDEHAPALANKRFGCSEMLLVVLLNVAGRAADGCAGIKRHAKSLALCPRYPAAGCHM